MCLSILKYVINTLVIHFFPPCSTRYECKIVAPIRSLRTGRAKLGMKTRVT